MFSRQLPNGCSVQRKFCDMRPVGVPVYVLRRPSGARGRPSGMPQVGEWVREVADSKPPPTMVSTRTFPSLSFCVCLDCPSMYVYYRIIRIERARYKGISKDIFLRSTTLQFPTTLTANSFLTLCVQMMEISSSKTFFVNLWNYIRNFSSSFNRFSEDCDNKN